MIQVNVHEAKAHLSLLLDRVESGEEIVIAKEGTPVARLIPCNPTRLKRIPGQDAGKVQIAEDFDAPLPEELLRLFES
jgi:prevent-host-death family protein